MTKSFRSFKDSLLSFVVNSTFLIITLAIALLPTWIYLLVKFFFSPQGFWQNAFLLGISVWFLGGLQVVIFILWLIFALKLCLSD